MDLRTGSGAFGKPLLPGIPETKNPETKKATASQPATKSGTTGDCPWTFMGGGPTEVMSTAARAFAEHPHGITRAKTVSGVLEEVDSRDKSRAVLFDARKDLVDREVQRFIDCLKFMKLDDFCKEDIPRYKDTIYNCVANEMNLPRVGEELSGEGHPDGSVNSLLDNRDLPEVQTMLELFEKDISNFNSPKEILNYIYEKCCSAIEAAWEESSRGSSHSDSMKPGMGAEMEGSQFINEVNRALKPIAALLGRDVRADEILGDVEVGGHSHAEGMTYLDTGLLKEKIGKLLLAVAKDKFEIDISVQNKKSVFGLLVDKEEIFQIVSNFIPRPRSKYSNSDIVFIFYQDRMTADDIIAYLSKEDAFSGCSEGIPFSDIINHCPPDKAARLLTLLLQQGQWKDKEFYKIFLTVMSQKEAGVIRFFLASLATATATDQTDRNRDMKVFSYTLLKVYLRKIGMGVRNEAGLRKPVFSDLMEEHFNKYIARKKTGENNITT